VRVPIRVLPRTVAGDNTIFVAVRDGVSASALRDELLGQVLKGAA